MYIANFYKKRKAFCGGGFSLVSLPLIFIMTSTTNNATRIFQGRTLYGALADSLRARLFAHEFLPGAPLDEAALTAHYGVGHLPVAQALESLARERLLKARRQGGYDLPVLARAEIETLLATLGEIRRLAFFRRMENERNICLAAVDMPVSSRPWWGPSGLLVAPPFAVAAQSLYDQLRLGIGPALAEIEADGARRRGETMTAAIERGIPETLEAFCRESAQDFRRRVLEAFDNAPKH